MITTLQIPVCRTVATKKLNNRYLQKRSILQEIEKRFPDDGVLLIKYIKPR